LGAGEGSVGLSELQASANFDGCLDAGVRSKRQPDRTNVWAEPLGCSASRRHSPPPIRPVVLLTVAESRHQVFSCFPWKPGLQLCFLLSPYRATPPAAASHSPSRIATGFSHHADREWKHAANSTDNSVPGQVVADPAPPADPETPTAHAGSCKVHVFGPTINRCRSVT
jgi:hypothetical protein